MRNDMLEASSESLGRVAQTIIALVKIGEIAQSSPTTGGGIYMSPQNGSLSTPHLPHSRLASPSSPRLGKRYSPSSNLSSVPGSSFNAPGETLSSIGSRPIRLRPATGRSAGSAEDLLAPPLPPPPHRYSGRSSASTRVSVASSTTYSTAFSLLDNRASSRFGTTRSSATEATSIHPSVRSSVDSAEPYSAGRRASDREVAHKEDLRIQALLDKEGLPPRRPSYNRRSSGDPAPALSPIPRVPFPRTPAIDSGNKTKQIAARLSLPTLLPDSSASAVPEEASEVESGSNDPKAANPRFRRVRHNSELDTPGARTPKAQTNPSDKSGGPSNRSRFEGMVNLGLNRDDMTVGFPVSPIGARQPLIVREEGKPPVHYVSIFFRRYSSWVLTEVSANFSKLGILLDVDSLVQSTEPSISLPDKWSPSSV